MEYITIIILILAFIVSLWMSFLGALDAKQDDTLTPFQKKAQIAISIFIPYIGAAIVLHLVQQHSPEAFPKSLIPWPLKLLFQQKHCSLNKNRDENNITATWGRNDNTRGDNSSGGD